jgi:Leucine-rich repeat (LRR) protein
MKNELSEQNYLDKIKQLLCSDNLSDVELALMIAESNEINLDSISEGLMKILSLVKVTPRLKNWEEAPFEKLLLAVREVSTMTFEDCIIEKLPDEIALFKNIFLLEIHGTGLKELNPKIKYLKNMISLSLKNNHLEYLPDEILGLVNIKSLNLNNNRLKALPANFGKLINLSTLELSKNPNLSSIPESVKEIPSLKKIVLDKDVFNHRIPELMLPLQPVTEVLWEEIKPFFKK